MIDLKSRLDESVQKVRKYGSWVSYGGLVVMIASAVMFIVEFIRMMNIMRLPGLENGHVKMEDLEAQLSQLEEQEREQVESSNLWTRLNSDIDNQKAVLMGNKESIIFVYMINTVVCVLFFIQGVLMWRAAKPTIEMTDYLLRGGVENVPADLMEHT